MIDRTKAIIGLVLAIIALILYANRLEHRLTVMEQQNKQLTSELAIRLDSIDDNQRRMMQLLFFD